MISLVLSPGWTPVGLMMNNQKFKLKNKAEKGCTGILISIFEAWRRVKILYDVLFSSLVINLLFEYPENELFSFLFEMVWWLDGDMHS